MGQSLAWIRIMCSVVLLVVQTLNCSTVHGQGQPKPGSTVLEQLLTPGDLVPFVSSSQSIESRTTATVLQLRKQKTDGIRRAMRVPLLRPYFVRPGQDLHIEVTVRLRQPLISDADILFLISDSRNLIGFVVPDKNEASSPACYDVTAADFPNGGITQERFSLDSTTRQRDSRSAERYTGEHDAEEWAQVEHTHTGVRRGERSEASGMQNGEDVTDWQRHSAEMRRHQSGARRKHNRSDRDEDDEDTIDRDHVTSATFLFKPSHNWGLCVTRTSDTGQEMATLVTFPRSINAHLGLYLDVYLDNEAEIHNIVYIATKVVMQ